MAGFLSWLLLSYLRGSGHETTFRKLKRNTPPQWHFVCSCPLYELNMHTQMHSFSSSISFTMCCIEGKLNHTKLVTNDLKKLIEKQRYTGCEKARNVIGNINLRISYSLHSAEKKDTKIKSCTTITSFFLHPPILSLILAVDIAVVDD